MAEPLGSFVTTRAALDAAHLPDVVRQRHTREEANEVETTTTDVAAPLELVTAIPARKAVYPEGRQVRVRPEPREPAHYSRVRLVDPDLGGGRLRTETLRSMGY